VETLLLVRHAFADSNRDVVASCAAPGGGLASEGKRQARRLAAELEGEEIDLGVATELRRSQETLELVLEGRGEVPRMTMTELNEIDFGSFDGGPLEAYRVWAVGHPPELAAPGGGESRVHAAARFARGLRLLLGLDERTVLAVAHALAVRYVLDAAAGLVPASLIAPVEHAAVHRLAEEEVVAAAGLLEEWSRAPLFRTR